MCSEVPEGEGRAVLQVLMQQLGATSTRFRSTDRVWTPNGIEILVNVYMFRAQVLKMEAVHFTETSAATK